MNLDELARQIEQDDRAEQRLMTPIEYARLRSMLPQTVYYHIRQKHLVPVWCDCGRKCVVREEADEYFQINQEKEEDDDASTPDDNEQRQRNDYTTVHLPGMQEEQ